MGGDVHIGEPRREYTIEPIVDPVPRSEPAEVPQPVEVPSSEPEAVPA
jgi:hypothetical protein